MLKLSPKIGRSIVVWTDLCLTRLSVRMNLPMPIYRPPATIHATWPKAVNYGSAPNWQQRRCLCSVSSNAANTHPEKPIRISKTIGKVVPLGKLINWCLEIAGRTATWPPTIRK